MALDILIEESTAKLTGDLTETVSRQNLNTRLKEIQAKCQGGRVAVDFSGIRRYNSLGIQAWLEASQDIPIKYVHCPYWQVECFNIEIDFLVGDVVVESLLAPFRVGDSEEIHWKLLYLGEDIPLQDDYSEYQHPKLKDSDGNLEPAFDESYLSFIPSIKNRMQA